jgi:hypothetical protein
MHDFAKIVKVLHGSERSLENDLTFERITYIERRPVAVGSLPTIRHAFARWCLWLPRSFTAKGILTKPVASLDGAGLRLSRVAH